MTFRLRVDDIEVVGGETLIRGRLVDGSYFGPQYIRVRDTAGNMRTAAIVSHGMIGPQQWPVTVAHDTQLELYIATPAPPFVIDRDSPVEGLGGVALRKGSIDLTKELSNPLFWGGFSVIYMYSDEMEQPYIEFLGLSEDEVNSYYTDFLEPLIGSPTWPIFPLKIDGNRYVEVEWAGGAEYQERVWIGTEDTGERALLGYDSGHFSLPGLRPGELVWLLDRLEQADAHPAAGLLLMPMCYLPTSDALLSARLAKLCAHIPGANRRLAGTMVANLIEHRIVADARWERTPRYGWCSDWPYSQRNPQSPMSVLCEADFGFIDRFFCGAKP